MLIAIDIGNTNITLGIFEQNKIVKSWRLATDITRTEDEYGIFIQKLIETAKLEKAVDSAVISSVVVQLTEKIKIALEKYLGLNALIISHKVKTGITLKTDNPSQIGADRIANAVAAVEMYKAPVIVIDFGTATSFDIINNKREFVGGIITAGMKIQAEALSQKTSKLPKLNIEECDYVIGKNTIEAMLSGIVRGHAAMIDGLVADCEKELGQKATIVATGGYSTVIGKYLKRNFDDINPDLTLIGEKIIHNLNR
ncbi:type III pantothenate kinase [bacterium]|nr:type III pantothenate kinase [bacterium]